MKHPELWDREEKDEIMILHVVAPDPSLIYSQESCNSVHNILMINKPGKGYHLWKLNHKLVTFIPTHEGMLLTPQQVHSHNTLQNFDQFFRYENTA